MICRHKLYHFTVANLALPRRISGAVKRIYLRLLNDILTLDQRRLFNQSDFPPISWPWYRLWPSPNYEWFQWSICNGCDMPAGNAYPSGHLVSSPPLFGTCLCSNCWDQIPRTWPCLYSTFHLEYHLVLSRFCSITICVIVILIHSI